MNKYKIQFSVKSKNDLKIIINYIRYNLLEPNIAKRYSKLIQGEIRKLEYSPQKFPIIGLEKLKHKDIRKLVIKKYIVFYIVDEEKNLVIIDRILSSNMNWKDMI